MIGNHSWIVDANGYAWGTGYNMQGQLGLGHRKQITSFTKINIDDVKEVVAGNFATFIIRNDNSIFGSGTSEMLGLGTGDIIESFINIGIKDIKNISCGHNYTFIIKQDGTVWSTGNNQYGQLGLEDNVNRNTFTKVDIENVQKISCGAYHTIAIKKDGTLWGTGYNYYGGLGLGDNEHRDIFTKIEIDDVKDVVCSDTYTFLIKNDGTVWATGNNSNGNLGLGDNKSKNTFTKVDVDNIKEIHCGVEHSIALKNDGTIWGAGSSYYGQLGWGTNSIKNVFTKLSMSGVKQISASSYHTIIIRENGTVWGAGYNSNGQLGLGNDITNQMSFLQIGGTTNNVKLWKYSFENNLIAMLLYYSDKYFKLNKDRLLEEVSILTENDFLGHGISKKIDLTTPDINGNRPVDLLPEEFEIRVCESKPENISIKVVEPSYKLIDDLDDIFEILTYTEEESDNRLGVKALPKDNTQLVIPTSDINIRHVEGIDRCYVNEENDGGTVKITCSTDSGRTWKVFKDGNWINIELNKESVSSSGMTTYELGEITREQWDLITENRLIRFAYLVTKDSINSTYGVDKLEILVDMKGTWNKAIHGTDYRYKYPNNYLLKVELKTDGTYKINYGD